MDEVVEYDGLGKGLVLDGGWSRMGFERNCLRKKGWRMMNVEKDWFLMEGWSRMGFERTCLWMKWWSMMDVERNWLWMEG